MKRKIFVVLGLSLTLGLNGCGNKAESVSIDNDSIEAQSEAVIEQSKAVVEESKAVVEQSKAVIKESKAEMKGVSNEDVLLENQGVPETSEEYVEAEILDIPQFDQIGYENLGEAILNSGMSVSDYIAKVQLSKEQMRAKKREALQAIIDDPSASEATKQQAIEDIIQLTNTYEKENASETLLMAKGFSDPLVTISSDRVDVFVNISSITDAKKAQIEEIVMRKFEVPAEYIFITILDSQE